MAKPLAALNSRAKLAPLDLFCRAALEGLAGHRIPVFRVFLQAIPILVPGGPLDLAPTMHTHML